MPELTITKSFVIEAAHYFAHQPEGHSNRRMHGHSYLVEVTIVGGADPVTGMIQHFDDFTAAMEATRDALDHRLLNDIPGLEAPSMENLTLWIANHLKPALPTLKMVTILRPLNGEKACYTLS